MNDLTPKQLRAIPLMAQGKLGTEVAKEISVSAQTISTWKKSPTFVAALNDHKYAILEAARSQLQHAPGKAVATLIELMDSTRGDEIRRRAALDILRLAGYEPGHTECFGWGIGKRDPEDVLHDQKGTINYKKLLQKYNY